MLYDRGVRILALIALAGCGVADFDIEQPIIEQRVNGSPLPGPLAVLFPLPLDINISQKIKEMETGPIDRVTLSSLTLTITATAMTPAGDTDNWEFVDDIRVYVKSSKSGSTLQRTEIASVTAAGAVTTLTFKVKDVNLQPYVEEGSIVEGESSGRLPPDDVTYNGEGVFTVDPL
jgi:hypothetical protein